MKILKGSYQQASGFQEAIEILVLNEQPDSLRGIALQKLNETEKEQLLAIQKEYEAKLQPFMTSFRNYKKEKFMENTQKD